ncbi:YfhO family protein [Anaerovorax odorimutans]|uniref:YfhO family protein n=1 Tax=Anaerovorax odorimutans TaxID=109327 RepID=A0ABT1RNN1_9FIRM|nr:YfhO family protein [Anaerovorax odorimutans]MCQ4636781.1 YfhO family protein [Anaerovorax odorimutans]
MTRIHRSKGFLYKNRYIFLAFFVPFLLMLLAFASMDFFPFGENQAAVIDMYHQYYPFISELHDKLQSGGSLLYSWDGGLGSNFLTLLSYYAASPLYFLTILVPNAYLMEAVTLIILIKIGLAGAFMAVYLRGMHKRCDFSTVAFSALYALCAYVMGYYWCLMWLDVVALLPLCMLGLNRLIDRGDFKLYTISLAAMMITNYYIGGMVCIFILFYYPILYFSRIRKRGIAGCARITGKAVLCSVTGILISGVTLLPTFLNMQNTYYIDSQMPTDSTFYTPLMDIITNLLPQTQLTVREGLPNIYCGLIAVMMLVFFLLAKSIPLRKKLLNCVFLAFLVLSLNWNKLDFMWHGFHFPNQLPFRYSFVVSFLLIALAYEAFTLFREISFTQIAGVTAGICGYVILAQKLYKDDFSPEFAYVCLLLLFAYAAFLAVYRTGKFNQTLMCFVLLVIVGGELMNHTALGVEKVSYTNRAEYFAESQDVRQLAAEMRKKDKSFYRMEVSNPIILNSPMLYDYPGVSMFSSTVNGDVSYFMEHIGLEAKDVKNRYNYVMTTPVANAMLNVKYLMGRGVPIEGEDALALVGGKETSTLYENRYDLSIGYMVDMAAAENWDYNQENPFLVLNDFVKTATGSDTDIFHSVGGPLMMGSGVSLGTYENGQISCTAGTGEESPTATLTFTSPQEQQVYVYVETDGAETISAKRENGQQVDLREDCGAVVSVGKCAAGETIDINIQYEDGQAGAITAFAYGMDMAAWDQAYALLDDETLQVANHSDTKIEGTIDVEEDGYFVTSIPYEKGWTIEVDGEKRDPETLGNAFLAIPLEAGHHEIRMTYLPDGFIPGILLSLCGIGILIALCFVRKRRGETIEAFPLSEADGGLAPDADKPEIKPEIAEFGEAASRGAERGLWLSGLKRRRFL